MLSNNQIYQTNSFFIFTILFLSSLPKDLFNIILRTLSTFFRIIISIHTLIPYQLDIEVQNKIIISLFIVEGEMSE